MPLNSLNDVEGHWEWWFWGLIYSLRHTMTSLWQNFKLPLQEMACAAHSFLHRRDPQ